MARPIKPQHGDEAELFESFNAELLRKIAGAVRTSPQVVEDACAFAWMEFLRYQPERQQGWKGWLFVTAQREAWRLDRERHRTATIDAPVGESGLQREPRDPHNPQDQALGLRATVEVLEQIPPRLRRIAFLRGVGLPYREIVEITGDSPRRVNVLVTRANDQIRRSLDAALDPQRDLPPRARRLRELEDAPPSWLVAEIGPIPPTHDRRASNATRTLYWRRAALAIVDYRTMTGFDDQERGLGDRPAEGAAQRAFDVAVRAVQAKEARRRVSRELE